jgi:sugar lactone lactonase YvrE
VECIANSQCTLGEAPLWLQQSGTLCWLDIAKPTILFQWDLKRRATRSWILTELACGLAQSERGEVLVVGQGGLSVFDFTVGRLAPLVAAPFDMQGVRFNDCGCDPLGRLWTGTMINDFCPPPHGSPVNPAAGRLLRIDPDLSCHITAEGIGCPNTFVWSPDAETLYTADSAAGCLYAYAYNAQAASLADRRVFTNPTGLGIPDGSAIDAEGYIWNARWDAGCVARFAPDGSLASIADIPARRVTSCAFGGPALETLFVTTARVGLSDAELATQPRAGGVFAFKPGVLGRPPSLFRRPG